MIPIHLLTDAYEQNLIWNIAVIAWNIIFLPFFLNKKKEKKMLIGALQWFVMIPIHLLTDVYEQNLIWNIAVIAHDGRHSLW